MISRCFSLPSSTEAYAIRENQQKIGLNGKELGAGDEAGGEEGGGGGGWGRG